MYLSGIYLVRSLTTVSATQIQRCFLACNAVLHVRWRPVASRTDSPRERLPGGWCQRGHPPTPRQCQAGSGSDRGSFLWQPCGHCPGWYRGHCLQSAPWLNLGEKQLTIYNLLITSVFLQSSLRFPTLFYRQMYITHYVSHPVHINPVFRVACL